MTSPVPDAPDGDARAEQLVHDVLGCLCTLLAERGRGVCCCHWARSGQTVMPQACDATSPHGEGVAWVRIAERRFVQQAQQRGFGGRPCGVRWAEQWALEIGVARCWPGDDHDLECGELTAESANGAWDEALLVEALTCCAALVPYGIVPQRVRTLGPQGGCIAAVLDVLATPVLPRKDSARS